jgi:hypothetical protein
LNIKQSCKCGASISVDYNMVWEADRAHKRVDAFLAAHKDCLKLPTPTKPKPDDGTPWQAPTGPKLVEGDKKPKTTRPRKPKTDDTTRET